MTLEKLIKKFDVLDINMEISKEMEKPEYEGCTFKNEKDETIIDGFVEILKKSGSAQQARSFKNMYSKVDLSIQYMLLYMCSSVLDMQKRAQEAED